MRRPGRHRLPAAAVISLASALVVAGCAAASTGTGSSGTPTGSTSTGASAGTASSPASDVQLITVTYAGGVISPPEGRVPVKLGSKVEIRVTSDVSEIVHNHFNNVEHDVAPGGTVVFDFTADRPGIYEVELHKSNKLLLELEVQ
jgi:heme/copper-type cytochrome/quinol oxidase subunit 2